MAVTIANRPVGARISVDNAHIRLVDITGPASYTTGGETLTAADIKSLSGNSRVIGDIAYLSGASAVTGHRVELDAANSKLKYFNGTTEVTSTTDLHLVVCRCLVVYGIVNG